MTREGFGIAQIHQSLEQPQRIVETAARMGVTADPKCQERASSAAQILLYQRIIRAIGKPA